MDEIHKTNPDEEEDMDLDALRLAALQSLKKKSLQMQQQQPNNEIISPLFNTINKDNLGHFSRGKAKRGKFIRHGHHQPRNGQFNNNWTRNSNLISVPMISDDPEEKPASESPKKQEIPKLVLPQDRYCRKNPVSNSEKSDNASSKFDRYNNSDQSDSDSDEDRFGSDQEELKPSNSLDNLMAALENEIQGKEPVEVKKDKTKPKKKRKLSEEHEETEIAKKETLTLKENLQPEPAEEVSVEKPVIHSFNNNNKRKWVRPPRKFPVARPVPVPVRVPEIIPVQQQYPIASFQQNFSVYNNQSVYVPPQQPPMMFEVPPPPVYERPLSPLAIKTDFVASAGTLGPLSPRSAAFVLQNRAIIEKRKRRSYSRSPSPRFAPKSPKRFSLSPKRQSKSPPSKRRSLSPSPVRKVLPPRNQARKQASIHDRLGIKTREEISKKEKLKDEEKEREKVESTIDPVLEARRKKFERSEINLKGGVIRLRTNKDEEMQAQAEKEEEKREESDEKELEFEDTIELLDHNNDLLFSDEESDSDNEGRFKTKQESGEKVQVLPFRKLVNGSRTSSGRKQEKEKEKEKKTTNDERARVRKKRHRTSRSPTSRKVTSSSSSSVKKTSESKVVSIKQTGIFSQNNAEKKIEIKIRNPSKYDREKKSKSSEEKGSSERKVVEIHRSDEDVAEPAEEPISSEGDLRAQLSRKRAERQKHPVGEVVLPTRLLRNALQQSVGLRKTPKAVKDETVEGKLPIHLRLGSSSNAGGNQSLSESSAGGGFGKKSRKHIASNSGSGSSSSTSGSKIKGASLEQV